MPLFGYPGCCCPHVMASRRYIHHNPVWTLSFLLLREGLCGIIAGHIFTFQVMPESHFEKNAVVVCCIVQRFSFQRAFSQQVTVVVGTSSSMKRCRNYQRLPPSLVLVEDFLWYFIRPPSRCFRSHLYRFLPIRFYWAAQWPGLYKLKRRSSTKPPHFSQLSEG